MGLTPNCHTSDFWVLYFQTRPFYGDISPTWYETWAENIWKPRYPVIPVCQISSLESWVINNQFDHHGIWDIKERRFAKLPRNLGNHSSKEHVVPKKQEVLYKVIISGKLYIIYIYMMVYEAYDMFEVFEVHECTWCTKYWQETHVQIVPAISPERIGSNNMNRLIRHCPCWFGYHRLRIDGKLCHYWWLLAVTVMGL